MAYDFSLDRKSAVVLSAGMAVILVLVFAAGVLTGVSWRAEEDYLAANRQKQGAPAMKPAASPVPALPRKTESAAAAPPESAPAGAGPAPQSPAAAQPSQPAATPAQSTAAAAAAPSTASPAAAADTVTHSTAGGEVQLAVQVGAFLDKANAEKLAGRLKEEGYEPQIILAGHAPRSWSIVRVGPYHDWDQASEIAAVLSRDQPSPAVVRPMR